MILCKWLTLSNVCYLGPERLVSVQSRTKTVQSGQESEAR